MLNSIFQKTLYEKRWMTFWWSISGTGLVVFILSFFHTMQDSLGQSLNDVPESMRSILGDAAAYQTLTGYLDLQVFEQMVFLPIILGIILGTGLLAGDENEGTLQTLLSYPVSRSKVYMQKLLAIALIVAIVTGVSLLGGTVLGALLIDESVSAGNVAVATGMAWLVSMVFTIFGFAVGAMTGKRGLAGALAGVLAFISFLVSSLVEGVKALKAVDYVSPFHYYNKPSPLESGLQAADAAVLAAICIVLVIAGYLVFIKRDIYPR